MIDARQLQRIMPDGSLVPDETSFHVGRGQIAALVGPNGSGKSTLLRCLCGDVLLEAGRARLAGYDCSEPRVLRRGRATALVSAVPTSLQLTVAEHLQLLMASWDEANLNLHESDAELAKEFSLTQVMDQFPHQLSSGQSQCLQLAMTLGRQADVILLDEPERHLDTEISAKLLVSLRRRAESGAAILIATHDERFAEEADFRFSPGDRLR